MAARYWVGGTGSWDATSTTHWSATSGGASGASVPTASDIVFFDELSNATAYTVTCTGTLACSYLHMGPALAGNITWAGTAAMTITDGLDLSWGMGAGTIVRTYTGALAFNGSNTGNFIFTNGVSLASAITINGTGDWTLAGALTTTGTLTVTQGTFTTDNYNVTATSLSSSNSNTRTINLGSSTVTLSASGATPTVNLITTSNLTFNAGTSQLTLTNATAAINSGGLTFYNVSFTSTALSTPAIAVGSNTFNNLSFAGRATAGIAFVSISANQTINGTLTLSAGTNATMRTFVRSDTIGTTRTLTCAAVATLTDIDFRDITFAGAAAPVSGTRLGDCKGNSGITFDTAKTVYYKNASTASWGGPVWSDTNGGAAASNFMPLAQDTAVFPSSPTPYPSSGNTVTINAAYNIGTIDMSARTSNTMTLATGSTTPTIYGNWINGTGTTLTGTGVMTFAGRGSQTITSAGKTFTQPVLINSPSGSVTLQDAFVTSSTSTNFTAGTFDANGYNVTRSGGTFGSTGTLTRTVAIGTGTWTTSASGNTWLVSGSNLTVTGTGTISLTSASAKTFTGGDIQTYPTINQGGTGALTISGSNKFANITNTAIGSVLFTGGTTNEFTAFNLNGTSTAARLTLGSTNTTQVTLKAPSWNVGTGSLDSGNNTGLSFTAGTVDFLNISYVIGVETSTSSSTVYYGSTNVTVLYYGSTPVTSVYYGSTQVF